jgi:hypothetical protein
VTRLLRRWIPDRERILANRWLRWLGPRLLHPRLWHASRRGIAVGVALGVFFGLLVPVAQIPLSAGLAVLLRANVPAAVASTLVTNPFTFAPVYLLAYQVGAALLGEELPKDAGDLSAGQAAEIPAGAGWLESVLAGVLALGKPLLLGLAIFAVAGGLLTYGLIMLGWRIRTTRAWKRRRRRDGPGGGGGPR